ncbi:Phosphoribosyl-ATP pyrophosphohydrolase [Phocoenobacter uteri]|uniref:Phosphoribosyl-ATP pyrophosphohydrolase n=1 Tax=Phocoenobacter uteri TaxID=146806 RepID=A0A379C9R2_9PAST|nr:nucleoside triphosphate pyrophosphohydrolase family protein [Phocoenobacter uteri]MDG6880982.1 hypothetical protein [Phocoenobacter uteri]SUB59001.1 Phosphoribosyl-ATP pyrophosphohydrolase [Phocoenobacter uteri]SUB76461.1 Phosphoribosyl-ATP pyrophosphohydrolase [Phocoenobacter uteri]
MKRTLEWFEVALSHKVSNKECIDVQYKCIAEEFLELQDAINSDNEVEQLDAICDIIVSCIGYAYLNSWDVISAIEEVNKSNFSKFENNKAVFNEGGKITKGKYFTPPKLEKFI